MENKDVTREQLREFIVMKFRTMSRYIRIIDQEKSFYHKLRALIVKPRSEGITELEQAMLNQEYQRAVETDDIVLEEEISRADREAFKRRIKLRYGSLAKLCRANPKVPRSNVVDILNGRTLHYNDTWREVNAILKK